MQSSTKLLIGIIVVGVIVFAITQFGGSGSLGPGDYDAFAQCLTTSGVTMYGAYWCPHCANQKQRFGNSFQYVNYVECDQRGDDANPALCEEKGVNSYPMWEMPDGSFLAGEQTLEALAIKTGCQLEAAE